jgi:hypothetical protein
LRPIFWSNCPAAAAGGGEGRRNGIEEMASD